MNADQALHYHSEVDVTLFSELLSLIELFIRDQFDRTKTSFYIQAPSKVQQFCPFCKLPSVLELLPNVANQSSFQTTLHARAPSKQSKVSQSFVEPSFRAKVDWQQAILETPLRPYAPARPRDSRVLPEGEPCQRQQQYEQCDVPPSSAPSLRSTPRPWRQV